MPTATSNPNPMQLDFLIIGGGLAGFSTAYTLAKAGHNVRVLERLPALGTPAGGLRVPPNMSKILKKWVGAEELAKTAVLNVATPWYDLNTGERMGCALWRPAVMQETGGDFLLMKHEDVHRLLYRLALSAGAQITFGAHVVSVLPLSTASSSSSNPSHTPHPTKPSALLSTGETLTADVILGADGPRSIVRKTVLKREDDPEPSGFTIFGGIIKGEDMKRVGGEVGGLVSANEWPIFMGTHRSLCAHPVRAKQEFAVQLYWPDEDAGTPADAGESWYDVVPTSSLSFKKLGPIVQKFMSLTPELYRTRWMRRKREIETWTDESGRIVLIGEAAHPWFPGGTYGPAMALEDAVVFGTLLSKLKDLSQLPILLSAYQELRQCRTTEVNNMDISNAAFVRLPPGEERDARNASIVQARDEWDDGASLKREFEGLAGLFCYDAEDAANEWWVTWGRYHSSSDPNDAEFNFADLKLLKEKEQEHERFACQL